MFSDVITLSDVKFNNGIPWGPLQPVYIKHVKILNFYLPHKGVWDNCQHQCNFRKSLFGMQEIFLCNLIFQKLILSGL